MPTLDSGISLGPSDLLTLLWEQTSPFVTGVLSSPVCGLKLATFLNGDELFWAHSISLGYFLPSCNGSYLEKASSH